VRLPDAVDTEGVSATMNNGVLTVTVPKAEPASTGHRIAVE
jgi:HSP20 family protein